jgi:hypothetical protein
MTTTQAVDYLASGHDLWSTDQARKICEAFDVPFSDHLIIKWKNQKDANKTNDPKGLWLDEPDKPGEGVGSIQLSNYVIRKLNIEVESYFGRGTQARANAQAIRNKFKLN